MSKRQKYICRAIAYEDAANYLRDSPMDEPIHDQQGEIVANRLMKMSKKMRKIADACK